METITEMKVCEACPNESADLKNITLKNGRKLSLCMKCYSQAQIANLTGKEFLAPHSVSVSVSEEVKAIAQEKAVKETEEAKAYMQSISHVTNPQEMPNPLPEGKRKITQHELFAQLLTDEQVRIEKFDYEKDGYQKLEERIALLEAIAFEAKTRATVVTAKKRLLDAASGKNRWDEHRGKENKSNKSDPRNSPLLKSAKDKHKLLLSKVDKLVGGYIELDYTDEEIMDALPEGKFKGSEVRESIAKMRGN